MVLEVTFLAGYFSESGLYHQFHLPQGRGISRWKAPVCLEETMSGGVRRPLTPRPIDSPP